MALTQAQEALLEAARSIIRLRGKPDWHTVGCAMSTSAGRLFSAVHLEAHVGRIAVCAEAIAIGMGAAQGDTAIAEIVAVDYSGRVVSPCGMCRELILDYSPQAVAIVPGHNELVAVPVAQLLPSKYHRVEG